MNISGIVHLISTRYPVSELAIQRVIPLLMKLNEYKAN